MVNGFVAENMGQTVSSASSFLWDAQTDLQGVCWSVETNMFWSPRRVIDNEVFFSLTLLPRERFQLLDNSLHCLLRIKKNGPLVTRF